MFQRIWPQPVAYSRFYSYQQYRNGCRNATEAVNNTWTWTRREILGVSLISRGRIVTAYTTYNICGIECEKKYIKHHDISQYLSTTISFTISFHQFSTTSAEHLTEIPIIPS